jgi:hypothetical protein
LRQIVLISVGGKAHRVGLINAYGSVPIVIDAASVGLHAGDGDPVPGSLRELAFGGEAFVRIPPGARVLSNPVRLKVRPEADLAISLYVSKATQPQTIHSSAFQTSYFVSGDVTLVEDVETDDLQMMREEYDSGDHLHPNDAGGDAMAEAINLRLFKTHRYH